MNAKTGLDHVERGITEKEQYLATYTSDEWSAYLEAEESILNTVRLGIYDYNPYWRQVEGIREAMIADMEKYYEWMYSRGTPETYAQLQTITQKLLNHNI